MPCSTRSLQGCTQAGVVHGATRATLTAPSQCRERNSQGLQPTGVLLSGRAVPDSAHCLRPAYLIHRPVSMPQQCLPRACALRRESAQVHHGTSPTPAITHSPVHCFRARTSATLWHTAAAEEALGPRACTAPHRGDTGPAEAAAARSAGVGRTSGGSAAGSSAAGTRAACAARARALAPAHRRGA